MNVLCREVFTPGGGVQYRSAGAFGVFVRGEQRCDATGLGSLHEWRDRRPRSSDRRPIVSGRATFERVYSDEEVTLLRGRFPLLGRIGFLQTGDDIVVVPNEPDCERAIREGQATLEYYQAGSHVFAFGGPKGRCPILGLVRPPATEDADR